MSDFLKSCDLKLDTWDTDYMWHLRHWLHCWQLRTTIWTITLWPLNREWWWQHSQFLRCFFSWKVPFFGLKGWDWENPPLIVTKIPTKSPCGFGSKSWDWVGFPLPRGGRLTSLDASFMRCFGFFQTSSKTSRSMFFFKTSLKHCIVKQKVRCFTRCFRFQMAWAYNAKNG